MRALSQDWMEFVASHNSWMQADCYRLEPLDASTPLLWTSADTNVGDYLGPASSRVIVSREGTRQTSGGETSTLDISLQCAGGPTLPDGRLLTQAASQGWLEGAKVQVDRAVMPEWGDLSLGFQRLFTGVVAEVEPSSTEIQLTCKSKVEYLRNLQMPRRIFQAGCPYALYSAPCGVVRAPVTVSVVEGMGSSLVVSDAHASDYWLLGTLQYLSGANVGLHRQIETSTLNQNNTSTLALTAPLPFEPLAGETVKLLRGCDKTYVGPHGCSSFGGRFGGYPWLPRAESIR